MAGDQTPYNGLDAVRKRPGMYVGDTSDGSGLHNMIFEVVNNAIGEALSGYTNRVSVELNADGSVTISDNGRGIPTTILQDDHRDPKRSVAEIVMTELYAGGRFDKDFPEVSGGLHGVGISVVNALSSKLQLTIFRDGSEHFMSFSNGKPDAPLTVLGTALGKSGTMVIFVPSTEIFAKTEFDFATLEHRLRELALMNSGVRILLTDHRGATPHAVEFYFKK